MLPSDAAMSVQENEELAQKVEDLVTLRRQAIKLDLDRNDPEAYRYALLGSAEALTAEALDEAERRIDYLYTTRDALAALAGDAEAIRSNVLQGQQAVVAEAEERILDALEIDDLDTAGALAVIGELGKASNEVLMQAPKMKEDPAKFAAVRKLAACAVRALADACAPLGLMQVSAETYWTRTKARRLRRRGLDEAVIAAKIVERKNARKARDFARADAILKELSALGIDVFDAAEETRWKVGV